MRPTLAVRFCGPAFVRFAGITAGAAALLFMAGAASAQPVSPAPGNTNQFSASQNQTNTVRTLSLPEAIRLALEHNFDLQIEQYNPLIAEFNLRASYGAYDPVFNFQASQRFDSSEGQFIPQFGITTGSRENWNENYSAGFSGVLPYGTTYDLSADLNRTSGSSVNFDPATGLQTTTERPFQYSGTPTFTLRQPLLRDFWINAARQQILVNKKTLKISETQLNQRIMEIITAVENAYYDLIFARENVKVLEKAAQLADKLRGENKKRVEVGVMARLDEKQAESQFATSQAALLSGQQSLATQQNVLKNLLTDDFTTWEGITIDPADTLTAVPYPVNISESRLRALSDRPELIQLRQEMERQDIILSYQRNQLFPAVDLTGSYGRNALGPHLDSYMDDVYRGDNPVWSGGIIIRVPLTSRTERYRYKASKVEKKRLLLLYKQQEQAIIYQIDDAASLVQSKLQEVEATRAARAFAEEALSAGEKKLESGKSTSFEVLTLQRDLTQARSGEIRALSEYQKAIVQLILREGSTLERNSLRMSGR